MRARTHALRFGSSDQIAMGYVVILTHPAVPCIFWQVFRVASRAARIVSGSMFLLSGAPQIFDYAARNIDGATSAVLVCFDCRIGQVRTRK